MPLPSHEPYLSTLSEEALLSLGGMEGLPPPRARAAASPWAGYALAAAIAAAAYGLHSLPYRPLGPAILAMLVGLVVCNLFPLPAAVAAGSKSLIRTLIPVAIVVTGAGLDLGSMASVGWPALSIIAACIAVAMAAAYYFGKLFGLRPATATLIAAGTGICGTNAIVAVAGLIDAEDDDLVLSIATVNLLGLVLMLAIPLVGHPLGLTDQAFGIWAGTSIQTVAQVVAAGFAFSQPAGAMASLVKLVRVTFLVPLVFVLAVVQAHRRGQRLSVEYTRIVPPFVWGFMAAAVLNTLGLLPVLEFQKGLWAERALSLPLSEMLTGIGNLVLTVAMAAIGLEVNLRFLAQVGARALLTGTAASLVLAAVSLGLVRLLL